MCFALVPMQYPSSDPYSAPQDLQACPFRVYRKAFALSPALVPYQIACTNKDVIIARLAESSCGYDE